jgi:hypothetical protein
MAELTFTLDLNEVMLAELVDAARECRCSPKIFAAESLESVLASRRLPRVPPARNGARVGPHGVADMEPEGYPVHLEQLEERGRG